jgi:hypothetical protein
MARKKKAGMHKSHMGMTHHAHMTNHAHGLGKKDPVAHPSHHQFNQEHGTPEGLSPVGGYDDEAAGSTDQSMGGNEEHMDECC